VPETWNYALSAAIATGAPIVASDLGSHRQRLASYPQAQLLPHGASVEAWLEALLATRTSVASSAGAGCELASSGQHYEERYLVKDTVEAAPPSVEILARLLRSLPAPSAEPQPALIDLFRLGRYAGHTGSANAVESELAALPPGEVHVVGRRIFETIAEQRAELEQRLQTASELLSASEARAAELSEKAAALAGELALAEDRLEQTSATLSAQQSRLRQLEEELADQHHRARAAQRHIDHLEGELARILASRSWRWTRPLRGLARMARLTPSALRLALYALRERPALIARGFRYLRYRGVIATLNRLERERFRLGAADPPSSAPLQEARPAIRPLALPTSHEPRLSILIPVYGQHEVTFGLLESLAAHWPSLPTEVLIADDASPIPAAQALAPVRGLRILRHAQNFGFLGNVNAAVREARGEWLLLLNNDTRVTAGAIDALLATFDKHERVGLVAAKLLNADGTLQEAGGIVWQDGSAWNYGRGEHAEDPRFNFVREIDYGSGAALLLRRRLWDQLGGFDPTFSPAYYEDTDLAMRVREAGLRVLYQPHAEIYHLEGVSHGTDLSQGVKAYQALNERRFAERWRARLADHRPNGVAPEREALRGRIGTVLIVEACMLTPDQDSGSLRMFNLMRLMLREGRHVVFIADNLEGTQPYRRQLEDEGVEVVHGAWAGGSVQAYLKAHGARFDTVILCRHYVASPLLSAVRSYAPHARVIFDTVDLHHLRELREAELHGSPQMRASALRTQQAELALVRAVDTTWVVAPTEAERLRAACPTAHIEVVSNVHEPVPARAAFEQRRGVLFVGGFRHPPNVDAIRWYAEAVLPQLRRLAPGLRTQVVGSHVPEEIRALACRELEILGYVPDLQPLLQNARVSIAPLRYGAGVKGKINEAMNHGIPVVATSVAVEGMHLRDGEDCLIADDPAAFARAIVQVHEDAALWRRLSEAGRRNVERYFSPQAVLGALRRSLRTNASAPATEVAFETAETRANVA
ncbi:MAG: glycosyltransferase, partial [Casimicrobiaceae bacterium]|nr:glycosyltransferase [Casimicrobiaceae bacterium]